MSDPIILKLTAAGLDAVLDAESGGFKCQITHCKLSSSRFESVEEDSITKLDQILHECNIAAGGVSVQARTLRFAVNIDVEQEIEVGSMGIYTSTGVLFAVASVTSGNLFKVYPKITFLGAFGITLGAKLIEYVQVLTDPNGAIAQKLLMDHETAEDPHPQYANQIEFAQAQEQLRAIVQGVYHVGSWHGTDNVTYNPRFALEKLFGYLTNWELRPYAPYGVLNDTQPVMELYDIAGSAERKAYTTRIWKRLPDDFKATIVANKIWVTEGEEIIYTIIADEVPDDTVVPYIFSGKDIKQNDINVPLEGNIVFQDNQAQLKIKVKSQAEDVWTNIGYQNWDESGEYPEKLLLSLKGAESNTAEVTIINYSIGLSQYRANVGNTVTAAFFYAGIPVGETIEWFVGTKTGIHTVTSEYGRIIESDVTQERASIGMTVVLSSGKRITSYGTLANSNQSMVVINNPVLVAGSSTLAHTTIYDREYDWGDDPKSAKDSVSASWGSYDSESLLDSTAVTWESEPVITGTGSNRVVTLDFKARELSYSEIAKAPSGAWLIYHVYEVNYRDYPNMPLGFKTSLGSVFCYKP